MNEHITSTERSALIRVASKLPPSSQQRRTVLQILRTVSARFQSFLRGDWEEFSGSLKFPDGADPIIGWFELIRYRMGARMSTAEKGLRMAQSVAKAVEKGLIPLGMKKVRKG